MTMIVEKYKTIKHTHTLHKRTATTVQSVVWSVVSVVAVAVKR